LINLAELKDTLSSTLNFSLFEGFFY